MTTSQTLTMAALCAMIDLTNLSDDATAEEIHALCEDAKRLGFASVCVRPNWVVVAKAFLAGSGVKVCTVISFHEGTAALDDKIAEARTAIARGATEISWVLNYQLFSTRVDMRSLEMVTSEIDAIAELAREFSAVAFKVIVEACALADHDKRDICKLLAMSVQVCFIETSTGHGVPRCNDAPKGATVSDVRLFAKTIAELWSSMEIMASGDVRSLEQLLALRAAGATRFGIEHEAAHAIVREMAEYKVLR